MEAQSKRIAILINAMAGGGAEKVMMSLADALVAQGHKPEFIVLTNKFDYDKPKGYPIHILYMDDKIKINGLLDRKKHAARLTAFVDSLQKSKAYDLFLSNLDDCHRIVSACHFAPCYYVIHNSIEETIKRTKLLGPLKYIFLKQCLRALKGKNLITVSKGIEREIASKGRIKPKSIQTIYNPFDIEAIQQLAQQSDADIPTEDYIIHVGRLAKQKRHDILFQAMQDVDPKYKLVCLCNKPKKALKLAAQYGVADRLIVPGFKQNPYPWIAKAKALVLSSDFEGLPTVLIEAIACNTTPVSTRCPHGPDEILRGDLQEFLAERRQPKQLAEKLNQALTAEVSLAQAEILEQVGAEEVARRYLALVH